MTSNSGWHGCNQKPSMRLALRRLPMLRPTLILWLLIWFIRRTPCVSGPLFACSHYAICPLLVSRILGLVIPMQSAHCLACVDTGGEVHLMPSICPNYRSLHLLFPVQEFCLMAWDLSISDALAMAILITEWSAETSLIWATQCCTLFSLFWGCHLYINNIKCTSLDMAWHYSTCTTAMLHMHKMTTMDSYIRKSGFAMELVVHWLFCLYNCTCRRISIQLLVGLSKSGCYMWMG